MEQTDNNNTDRSLLPPEASLLPTEASLLPDKIVFLIVNKDKTRKQISKELVKLGSILGDMRVSVPLTDPINENYLHWALTKSSDMLNEETGHVIDECKLNYPLNYVELSDDQFKMVIERMQKQLVNFSPTMFVHYCNTIITKPFILTGLQYKVIKNILNDYKKKH